MIRQLGRRKRLVSRRETKMAEQKDNMDYEFTWLEDFDHDALVVESVDSFVHL